LLVSSESLSAELVSPEKMRVLSLVNGFLNVHTFQKHSSAREEFRRSGIQIGSKQSQFFLAFNFNL